MATWQPGLSRRGVRFNLKRTRLCFAKIGEFTGVEKRRIAVYFLDKQSIPTEYVCE